MRHSASLEIPHCSLKTKLCPLFPSGNSVRKEANERGALNTRLSELPPKATSQEDGG